MSEDAKIDPTKIEPNVVLNVYVPLLIVATSIIYYGSKRSLDMIGKVKICRTLTSWSL